MMRDSARRARTGNRNVWTWIALASVVTYVGLASGCGAAPTQTVLPPTAPVVNVVRPNSGPASGGTVVTLFGAFFQSGVTVSFGGTASPTVSVIGPSQIAAVTPAHAVGTVDIVVTNTNGGTATVAGGFIYTSVPTVTAVSPGVGSIVGGTSVTITGTGFQAGATVTFGGLPASNVSVPSGAQINAITPAHTAGPVDVTVTNPDGGTATLKSGFTYGLPPSITSILPIRGTFTGGTVVTITGAQFQQGATVTFGGSLATGVVVSVDGTTIQATTPAHALGVVDVTVTNPPPVGGSATLHNAFTYFSTPPSITSILPTSGSALGGTAVVISGQFFQQNATVTFGGALATGVVVSADGTTIQATTPAGTAGTTVNVTVTNPDNQSATLAQAFTYQSVSHSVDLAWDASTSTDVIGYNVYRGTTHNGPYTIVNTSLISGLVYTDNTVTGGQTYYYVATAVDSNHNESVFSNEAPAVVPSP